MLEEKTYTLAEIGEVLGGGRSKQSIERKMKRLEIDFSESGRGRQTIFTIQKIRNPFKLFCIYELGFSPQVDFEKVRNLYYYFFNDEGFQVLPDEAKELCMDGEGHKISRQTIANYLKVLENLGIYENGEYYYYFAHKGNYKKTDRKTYGLAWKLYWDTKAIYDDTYTACSAVIVEYGGVPRKQPIPELNGIYNETIAKIRELTNESFLNAYAS